MAARIFGRKTPEKKTASFENSRKNLDLKEMVSSLKEMEENPSTKNKKIRNLKPRRVLCGDGELDELVRFVTREDDVVERLTRKLVREMLKQTQEDEEAEE